MNSQINTGVLAGMYYIPFRVAESLKWAYRHKSSSLALFDLNGTEPSSASFGTPVFFRRVLPKWLLWRRSIIRQLFARKEWSNMSKKWCHTSVFVLWQSSHSLIKSHKSTRPMRGMRGTHGFWFWLNISYEWTFSVFLLSFWNTFSLETHIYAEWVCGSDDTFTDNLMLSSNCTSLEKSLMK